MTPEELEIAHKIARAFHETYERLAPSYGYVTREDSAKDWEFVPEQNKLLMVGVVAELLDNGVIQYTAELQQRHNILLGIINRDIEALYHEALREAGLKLEKKQ